MFDDGRSKRVIFIAHCLLNQNSISDGTAVYPAAFKDVINFFLNAEVNGMRLFVEKIFSRFLHEKISIPMIGIKGTDNLQEKLQQLINVSSEIA